MKNQTNKIGILSAGLFLGLSLVSFAKTDSVIKKTSINSYAQGKSDDVNYNSAISTVKLSSGDTTDVSTKKTTKMVSKDKKNKKKTKTTEPK